MQTGELAEQTHHIIDQQQQQGAAADTETEQPKATEWTYPVSVDS